MFVLATRGDLEAIKGAVNEFLRIIGSESRTTSPVPNSNNSSKKNKKSSSSASDSFVVPSSKKHKASASKTLIAMQQEISARAQLLSSDPDLKSLHTQLVVGGVVADADFWKVNAPSLSSALSRLTGAASTFTITNSLESTVDIRGSKTVTLTKEQMFHIFKMYPAVLTAYEDRVRTNEISEKEFWSQYFRSDYFYRDKGGGGDRDATTGDDMFSRIEERERRKEEEKRERDGAGAVKKLSLKASAFDLSATLNVERPLGLRAGSGNVFPDRDTSSGGDDGGDERNVGRRKVIEKYNKHGGIAVDAGGGGIEEEERGGGHREMLRLTEMAAREGGEFGGGRFEAVVVNAVKPKAVPAAEGAAAAGAGGGGKGKAATPQAPQTTEGLLAHLSETLTALTSKSAVSYDLFDAAKTVLPNGDRARMILKKLSASMAEATHR